MLDQKNGILMTTGIFDAIGAGYEYNPEKTKCFIDQLDKNPMSISATSLLQFTEHGKYDLNLGMYTDDTQMSIAIAEQIISGDEWTKENIAKRFVNCFKRDPRQGYAWRFYDFLQEISSGEEFLEKIIPISDRSGAAMRSGPIGLFQNIDEVIEKASIQSSITHNTKDGISSGVVAALMSHYFTHNLGPKENLGEFIREYVPGNWTKAWEGEISIKGIDCVHAAIHIISNNDNYSGILTDCIRFGGDVDTVAAIAGSAVAYSKEHIDDLPQRLYDGFENGAFGGDYLMKLDEKLFSLKSKI